MGWIATCVFYFYLRRENAKRERGERDELIAPDGEEKGRAAPGGVYESVAAAKIDKGDKWSGYRCASLLVCAQCITIPPQVYDVIVMCIHKTRYE